MKLKMTTGLCGPSLSLARGDEAEFDEAEAVRLVRAGFAVTTSAADEKAVSATIAKAEKAEAAAAKKDASAKKDEAQPEEAAEAEPKA